ncbi:MAG: hypothetical protein M1835_003484, partial [Candelina submexicana]
MAQHAATMQSSSTPSLPGLSHIIPPQTPQHSPTTFPILTLSEYSLIASKPELATLNIPHLTPSHLSTSTTSLASYAATIWNNNRHTPVSAEAVIGKWINDVKRNVEDPALQQEWFDQIHSPEFRRMWEVRIQVLRDPGIIDSVLYRPEHLPFSGTGHNTIRM